MNTNTFTSKDVLLHTIKYIEEHGWCQYSVRNAKGEVCLGGAIVSVGEEMDVSLWTADQAWSLVRDQIGGMSIPGWNDRPNRTKDEVIEVLRKAADRA